MDAAGLDLNCANQQQHCSRCSMKSETVPQCSGSLFRQLAVLEWSVPLLTCTESLLHASPVSSVGSSLFNCSLCQHSQLSSLLLCILSISSLLLSCVPVMCHRCMVKKQLAIFSHHVTDIQPAVVPCTFLNIYIHFPHVQCVQRVVFSVVSCSK